MAKQFARSLATKSKTDALDAAMLARLGLERALPVWKPFTPALRLLRRGRCWWAACPLPAT